MDMKKSKIKLFLLGFITAIVLLEIILNVASFFINKFHSRIALNTKSDLTILCLGDSHTYGMGASPDKSYPAQLSDLIKKNYPGKKINVVNLGRPGINTSMLADDIDNILEKYSPGIIILMTGANDIWNLTGMGENKQHILSGSFDFISELRIYKLFKIILYNLGNKIENKNLANYEFMIKKIKSKYGKKIFDLAKKYMLLLKRSKHYWFKQEYDKSAALLFAARKLDFNNHLVYEYLDRLFIIWKDHDSAINFYSRLKECYPQDLEISLRLARHYKAVRDYHKAKQYFREIFLSDFHAEESKKEIENAEAFIREGLTRDFSGYESYAPEQENDIHDNVVLFRSDYSILCDLIKMYFNDFDEIDLKLRKEKIYRINYDKLKQIYLACKEKNIKLFILSYPTFVRDYVWEIVKEYNIAFIDQRSSFDKLIDPGQFRIYFVEDGHCTARGYEIVADNVFRALSPYLEKDKTTRQ
jgi:lysophospholipase L1-like esterase